MSWGNSFQQWREFPGPTARAEIKFPWGDAGSQNSAHQALTDCKELFLGSAHQRGGKKTCNLQVVHLNLEMLSWFWSNKNNLFPNKPFPQEGIRGSGVLLEFPVVAVYLGGVGGEQNLDPKHRRGRV